MQRALSDGLTGLPSRIALVEHLRAARAADLVFRKGGEELVAALPGVTAETAPMAAERLRAAVRALQIPHRASDTDPMLTVTVGVATGAPGCTLRQLLVAAAGLAMSAKVAAQRNRIHAVHIDHDELRPEQRPLETAVPSAPGA